MFYFALILFFIALVASVDCLVGGYRVRWLKDVKPSEGPYPKVAIVIAARNEEKNIEEALQSVLAIDYPAKQIVVVNDRSTDRTGPILQAMASRHPELTVLNLTEVPAGWLGKNHALQRGYLATDSELVLFTDADVVFEPQALRRGVTFLQNEKLDHVPLLPEIRVKGFWLNVSVGIFGVYFAMAYRPWKAADPKSKRFVGVGGFNLVRRKALDALGGFTTFSLRPDDDLQLGRRLKLAGFRQELLWGIGTSYVEWYPTLREMIRGLEKNMFSGFKYRISETLAACFGVFFLNIYPAIGTFVATGAERLCWIGMWLLMIAAYYFSAHRTGQSRVMGIFFPVGAAIHLWMIVNAVGKTLLLGGIKWRDTFYSLDELRRQR